MLFNRSLSILFACLGIFTVLAFSACQSSEDDDQLNFDRSAMLTQYADQLIIPAYADANLAANDLMSSWEAFQADPTETQLAFCQDAWLGAALAWQKASIFNFGPAAEEGLLMALVEELSTFPVDTEQIEAFISEGDASLDNFLRDTRGYLALDYLLFAGSEDAAQQVVQLSDPHRQAYVSAVIQHIQGRLSEVLNDWNTFRTSFIENNGTDVGSSTSMQYNEFVRSFERVKNLKIGLPAGRQAAQEMPEPELVEAYYSGLSLALIEAHLQALEEVYYGRSKDGLTTNGFADYLQAVEGGPELVTLTEDQWMDVIDALAQVPTDRPVSALAAEENSLLIDFHTELQKHTRFFKSDMSSLLGIAITFASGDGD